MLTRRQNPQVVDLDHRDPGNQGMARGGYSIKTSTDIDGDQVIKFIEIVLDDGIGRVNFNEPDEVMERMCNTEVRGHTDINHSMFR